VYRPIWAIKNRKKGYIETLKKHNLKPCLVPTGNSLQTADNQEFGYENMVAYLKESDVPKALFCATDRVAMGVIYALQERGLVVGRDVLVAGHDNLHFGAFMNPTLTTVAQPKQEIGAECVKSLLSLIRAKKSKPVKIQKVLKPRLIIRQSTLVKCI
jgi:LacI family transcriptional regulator